MSKLEDLHPKVALRGIFAGCLVTVINVQWFGSDALDPTYKIPEGKLANEYLYRHNKNRIEVVEQGRACSFDGDEGLFRLVSKTHQIHLTHIIDLVLAVYNSMVDLLLHQITAVYDSILTRQSLHFMTADDTEAGKTIISGLLICKILIQDGINISRVV